MIVGKKLVGTKLAGTKLAGTMLAGMMAVVVVSTVGVVHWTAAAAVKNSEIVQPRTGY
jgi:hypothetical protein